jgi:hypothetical protein
MATIHYKWGGSAWQTAGNGQVWGKWSGINSTNWFPAMKVGVHWGGTTWYDTGYTGQPSGIAGLPWVAAWDYTNLTLAWTPGSGGEPNASYEYVLTDGNGNWIIPASGAPASTTATSVTLPINWDRQYQFWVRSVGINGIRSGWQMGGGRVASGAPGGQYIGIGHPRQDTYGYVTRQTAWSSQTFSETYLGGNQWWGLNLPTNRFIDAAHWQSLMLDGTGVGNQIVQVAGTGGTARWVSWFFDSNWQDGGSPAGAILGGATIDRFSYFNYDVGFSPGWWGNGNVWGMGPRGAGWSSTGNTNYMLWCENFWFTGQQLNTTYEITSTISATGNYYWG